MHDICSTSWRFHGESKAVVHELTLTSRPTESKSAICCSSKGDKLLVATDHSPWESPWSKTPNAEHTAHDSHWHTAFRLPNHKRSTDVLCEFPSATSHSTPCWGKDPVYLDTNSLVVRSTNSFTYNPKERFWTFVEWEGGYHKKKQHHCKRPDPSQGCRGSIHSGILIPCLYNF